MDNNRIELKVFPSLDDLSQAAANIFTGMINSDGENTFIVPGGSTPHLFYQHLAEKVTDWSDVTLRLMSILLIILFCDFRNLIF